MGRPSKYKKEYCKKLKKHLKDGFSFKSFAGKIEVSRECLYEWLRVHKDFSYTRKKYEGAALLWWEELGRAAAAGQVKGFNPVAYVWCTKNMFGWKNEPEPERFPDEKIIECKQISSYRRTFQEFCLDAGYPVPFPKQIEMKDFILKNNNIKMLLGSRGYGKTEYITTLGIGYELYTAWLEGRASEETNLILTKSQSRNKAILREVARACEKQGMKFSVKNSTDLFLEGVVGINANVSAVTVDTCSLRGRHPKRIIFDDPVTPESSSPAKRTSLKTIYDEVVGKICQNVGLIGQPVHHDDLYQNIRDKIDLMEVPYGSIPELDPDLEAQRIAGVDEDSIQKSYYLTIPVSCEAPFGKVQLIDKFPKGESVAFIDPSFAGGDLTAISIMRAHFERVAVAGFCWKKAWNHCIDDFYKLCERFNIKKICFETNSLGDMPIDLLRQSMPQGVGIVGMRTTMNKHAKIMNAGTYAHLISISKESEKKYIDCVTKYEYNFTPDDPPDSLASCLLWLGLIRGVRK